MHPSTPFSRPRWLCSAANTAMLLATCLVLQAGAQTTTPASTFPVEAQALSPQALQERLTGKRFTSRYANGMTATLQYGTDQTLQLEMSSGLSAKGTWRVEGSQICFQFAVGVPSGCGESKATATQLFLRRYTNQEVVQLDVLPAGTPTTSTTRPRLRPAFHAVPADRPDVTMNIALLEPSQPVTRALLVVPGTPGSEGRIIIQNAMDVYNGKLQYLAQNADVFDQAGIALVAMGCPTDQWALFGGKCDDDYRSSPQYVSDASKVMAFLRSQYGVQEFWIFGHSSGGISSRWLALKMPDQLKGAIHSSAMNGTAGNLARTMLNFDMGAVQIPMLHIAHEQDQCPSTLYAPVTRYAKDNLVTVRGGGQSGPVCGGSNRHSFEGRQRGVSRAIVQWINTGKVQPVVDSDE